MDVDERLSLEAVSAHTLIAVEHRHRYEFAAAACAGRRVLDLCCGTGYGSAIMASSAAAVVGVDRDAASIDAARTSVKGSNLTFVAADALDHLRALSPQDVDLVVCFEGLEHVPAVEEVIAQLVRLVTAGVGFIGSVPNSVTFGEDNEFHVTDFDLLTARRLFADLPGATFAYQTHAEGSLIHAAAAGDVDARVAVGGEQDLDWANHFLILAGVDTDALLGHGDANLHLAVEPVSHRYLRQMERAGRTMWATNARLTRDRLGVGAAGGASATLRGLDALAEAQRAVVALEARVHGSEALTAGLHAQADALRAERDEARAERDSYRRAWMAVTSSRLTNLAARVAGHRFP